MEHISDSKNPHFGLEPDEDVGFDKLSHCLYDCAALYASAGIFEKINVQLMIERIKQLGPDFDTEFNFVDQSDNAAYPVGLNRAPVCSILTTICMQVFFSPDGDDKYYPAIISIFAADDESRIIVFDKSKAFVHKEEEDRSRGGGRGGRGRGRQTPMKKPGRSPGRPKSTYITFIS